MNLAIQNFKKKRRIEELIKSQKGSIDKFATNTKKIQQKSADEIPINEQRNSLDEIENNELLHSKET